MQGQLIHSIRGSGGGVVEVSLDAFWRAAAAMSVAGGSVIGWGPSFLGTIAGAVIGFVLSGYNPQGAYWGAMIGGMAGGLIDETLQGAQFSGRSIAGSGRDCPAPSCSARRLSKAD